MTAFSAPIGLSALTALWVDVGEADELDFAGRGWSAELRGWFCTAEQEQACGFRAGLPGPDQEVFEAVQAGEVPGADRLGPLRLTDREQDALSVGAVAEGRDMDLE
jgi:hypothetical protein